MDRKLPRPHGWRYLGAIAGFVLGSLFDSNNSAEPSVGDADGQSQQQYYEGQRNTFRFSLLVTWHRISSGSTAR